MISRALIASYCYDCICGNDYMLSPCCSGILASISLSLSLDEASVRRGLSTVGWSVNTAPGGQYSRHTIRGNFFPRNVASLTPPKLVPGTSSSRTGRQKSSSSVHADPRRACLFRAASASELGQGSFASPAVLARCVLAPADPGPLGGSRSLPTCLRTWRMGRAAVERSWMGGDARDPFSSHAR